MRILPYNLLPDEARKTFRQEYRGRVIFVFFCCFTLFFLGSVFLLTPTLYMAYEREAVLSREVSSNEQEAARISVNQFALEVKRTNEAVNILAAPSEYAYAKLVQEIAKRRTSGVVISRMELSLGKSDGSILIGGLAATREELLAFRRAFERSLPFRGAEIPVGVFTKNRDIPFTMNIYIATGTTP